MANHRNAAAVLVIGVITMIVGGAGLFLGFHYNHSPSQGPPVPKQPDQGPILYDMRSLRSEPDRVRFEWATIERAKGYRITVLSAQDEALFTSPLLTGTSWVIPPELRSQLSAQTVYHWKVTVQLDGGGSRSSDPASFATQ